MPRKIEEVEQSLTVSGWGVVSPGTTVEVHQGAWGVAPLGAIHSGVGVPAATPRDPESLREAFERLTNMAKDAQAVAKAQAEKHLVWFDAPPPSPVERVIEPRVRAANLFDFLMRRHFEQGHSRGQLYCVKGMLEDYFKLQEEQHRGRA